MGERADLMKTLTPVEPKQRIEILDVLRGFALLGIIFNNMLYFSGYVYMPFADLKRIIDFRLNENIYNFLDIVITAKFYTLFSILFAVGFYIQFSAHKEDAIGFIKIYRRRIFILLMMGLAHSLIWFGDILLTYSLIAFIMILFRNVQSKNLLRWAIFFILLPLFIDLALLPFTRATAAGSVAPVAPMVHVNYPDMTPGDVIDTFQNGTMAKIFILNIHHIVWKYLSYIPSGGYFKFLGIFLLGYYLASIGFFTKKTKSTLLLTAGFIIGFLAAVSAELVGGSSVRFPPTPADILYKFLLSAGQIFICFFYMTSVFKIVRTSMGKRIFGHLIAVGRMALSNYLFQTIMMTIIFYNFGFNLFGRIGLIPTAAIAILILAAQIVFSNIWLRHFRFGPFEWLWRSLTYKKRIRIRV
jgi:uncharacterized protein